MLRSLRLLWIWTAAALALHAQSGGEDIILSDTVEWHEGEKIPVFYLDEVVVLPSLYFSKAADWYRYVVLRRKVIKVYPFAKMAGEDLEKLNARLARMTPAQQRRYKKMVERYIRTVIEPKLKELTVTEGRILVRLVYRQTGMSVYDFLKEYKSGLSAFWWQRMAKLYKIDLKDIYDPVNRKEDFWMEDILIRAFQEGVLEPSPPKVVVDYYALFDKWMEKMPKLNKDNRNFDRTKALERARQAAPKNTPHDTQTGRTRMHIRPGDHGHQSRP
ncbi:MAG: DUF4294 domain-containing protein [Chlorobi bacterium]|nr:DUF4294 domain-containing protein [Chlorobiota bacterium]